MLFQARLESIFEVFFAKQVEAVAAHAAKNRVEKASGHDAVRRIENGASDCEHSHRAPARPSLEKALRIPRKETNRTHGCEIQQAAFDPPEDSIAGRSRRAVLTVIYGQF